MSTTNILDRLVPITQFNRGKASRVFDRLHNEKQLIVLKNNQPAAIILSPEEYERLNETEEDYSLLLEAVKRLEDNTAPTISMKEIMNEFGISDDDLAKAEDPVIE